METNGNHPPSGDDRTSTTPAKSTKRGGWGAIRYILANESFEKLASMGLIANLALYLQSKYHLDNITIFNVVNIWGGTSNVASIAGAVISDVYLGRFLTLLFGSIASFLGIGVVALTAALPQLRPHPCHDFINCEKPHGWQIAVLFIGLGLLAIGAGGIRPCNIAFGADQFDTRTKKGRAQLASFFNWWYLLFTLALLIALTGVVYVQTNISWTIGFLIPTGCLALSITIFLLGRHRYIYRAPQGSAFVDIAKVVVAAYRKRKLKLQKGANNRFYNPKSEEYFEEESLRRPVLTDRLNCINKAAVIADPSELDDQGKPTNTWNLCSLEHVEQLKCLIGIVPVWCTAIGCFVVMDQQNTYGILQAVQMNRSLGPHFKVPPAWMQITSMLALALWISIYENIYIPWSKRTFNKARRLSTANRIHIGIFMSILCMLSAGLVERKRKSLALKNHSHVSPISIGYLLPQYVFTGLTEAFSSVACMEFFTIQMPETMRSVSGAVFFLSLSIGNYLSTLIANVTNKITEKPGKLGWLAGHDLNQNKLDIYYFIIGVVAVINFIYFSLFARKFATSGKALSVHGGEMQLESRSKSNSRKKMEESSLAKDEERDVNTWEVYRK